MHPLSLSLCCIQIWFLNFLCSCSSVLRPSSKQSTCQLLVLALNMATWKFRTLLVQTTRAGDSKLQTLLQQQWRVLEFQSAEGFGYKVLSIDLAAQKLIIKPPDLVQDDDMCRTTDFSSEGLRLDENLPFNVSTRNTVILLNCSDNLLRSPLNCSSNSLCRVFEGKMLEGRNNACKSRLCCHYLKDSHMTSHMIRVRVGGCTAYTSVVDIQPQDPADKWNYGIELQWMPPN